MIIPACYSIDEAEDIFASLSKFVATAGTTPRPCIKPNKRTTSSREAAREAAIATEMRKRSDQKGLESELRPLEDGEKCR